LYILEYIIKEKKIGIFLSGLCTEKGRGMAKLGILDEYMMYPLGVKFG